MDVNVMSAKLNSLDGAKKREGRSDNNLLEPDLTIILIHGTGAAASDDEGSAWWQVGSNFQSWLSRQLNWKTQPPIFAESSTLSVWERELEYQMDSTSSNRKRIFHWSGRNSETDRRNAGKELARVIDELEISGSPYALIGHSHGGSVIWHALLNVYRRNYEMRSLKSVVTLGTPFVSFTAGKAWLRQLIMMLVPIGAIAFLWSFWTGIGKQWFDLFKSGEYLSLIMASFSAGFCLVILLLSSASVILSSSSALREKEQSN